MVPQTHEICMQILYEGMQEMFQIFFRTYMTYKIQGNAYM
jgi:hypothetical protein